MYDIAPTLGGYIMLRWMCDPIWQRPNILASVVSLRFICTTGEYPLGCHRTSTTKQLPAGGLRLALEAPATLNPCPYFLLRRHNLIQASLQELVFD